jgi:hypothetical protein
MIIILVFLYDSLRAYLLRRKKPFSSFFNVAAGEEHAILHFESIVSKAVQSIGDAQRPSSRAGYAGHMERLVGPGSLLACNQFTADQIQPRGFLVLPAQK